MDFRQNYHIGLRRLLKQHLLIILSYLFAKYTIIVIFLSEQGFIFVEILQKSMRIRLTAFQVFFFINSGSLFNSAILF